VWRLTHGSDVGLGEYLLLTYDESRMHSSWQGRRVCGTPEPAISLSGKLPRRCVSLKDTREKFSRQFLDHVVRPLHALEPLFAHVAWISSKSDVLFLAANCDEDESLVKSYLEADKPRTPVVFAEA